LFRMYSAAVIVFASLAALSAAKPWRDWGDDDKSPSNINIDFNFGELSEGLYGLWQELWAESGPSFLRNVTKQAKRDYNKINRNQTMTKAQLTSAISAWAATNNVTAQVNEYNARQQQDKNQSRGNITLALQQLPNVLTKLAAIEDNQNITPLEEVKQTFEVLGNITTPYLAGIVLSLGWSDEGFFDHYDK
ncbi:hypothetical protein PFISCL1PPCAC_13668, partial [Pristionchus fissidentatus]